MSGSFIALNSVLHLSKHELDTMKVRFVDRNEETTAYKEYMKSPSVENEDRSLSYRRVGYVSYAVAEKF